jgi:hypothetical protein
MRRLLFRRIPRGRRSKTRSIRLQRVSRPLSSETRFATLTPELVAIRLVKTRAQSYATNGQKKGRIKNCTSLEPREMAEGVGVESIASQNPKELLVDCNNHL